MQSDRETTAADFESFWAREYGEQTIAVRWPSGKPPEAIVQRGMMVSLRTAMRAVWDAARRPASPVVTLSTGDTVTIPRHVADRVLAILNTLAFPFTDECIAKDREIVRAALTEENPRA